MKCIIIFVLRKVLPFSLYFYHMSGRNCAYFKCTGSPQSVAGRVRVISFGSPQPRREAIDLREFALFCSLLAALGSHIPSALPEHFLKLRHDGLPLVFRGGSYYFARDAHYQGVGGDLGSCGYEASGGYYGT